MTTKMSVPSRQHLRGMLVPEDTDYKEIKASCFVSDDGDIYTVEVDHENDADLLAVLWEEVEIDAWVTEGHGRRSSLVIEHISGR